MLIPIGSSLAPLGQILGSLHDVAYKYTILVRRNPVADSTKTKGFNLVLFMLCPSKYLQRMLAYYHFWYNKVKSAHLFCKEVDSCLV